MSEHLCPECGGIHLPDHLKGRITYRHEVDCPILHAEDRRALGDVGSNRSRPATVTERRLLEAIGHELLPDRLTTRLRHVTPGITRRDWPQLR